MAATSVLDQVRSLDRIEQLATEPARYADALAHELPPAATLAELEARDALLARALEHVDEFAARVMTTRLAHALASDTSLGAPTRKVFATTVLKYRHDLALLGERARELAQRGRAVDPTAVGEAVVAAARATLELHAAVCAPVLALVRELATSALPDADRRARDRNLDDAQRMRWSAARRDLESIAAAPELVQSAPMATRMAALPAQLDEPAAQPEVSFADMLELD
jgi:hypothetical protein